MIAEILKLCVISLAISLMPITSFAADGYCKGIKLCGKVKVVERFADLKVKVVDHFPDLRVKRVQHFPNEIGEWQFVTHGEDFTIQYVNSFPDLKIEFVDYFPGTK